MGFTQTDSIEVKQIKGKGRGVSARRFICHGETIERVPVLVLPIAESRTASGPTPMSGYCFDWGRGTVAVALGYGSLYNHSYHQRIRRRCGSKSWRPSHHGRSDFAQAHDHAPTTTQTPASPPRILWDRRRAFQREASHRA
jgi:hypothetical protein